mmetsp:Transcript_2177/g.5100  ORF Transcript_2177/g.5100 Transcript_2177/m.5100 type:complete len:377 (+) Transcript_2177:685-1815(+)
MVLINIRRRNHPRRRRLPPRPPGADFLDPVFVRFLHDSLHLVPLVVHVFPCCRCVVLHLLDVLVLVVDLLPDLARLAIQNVEQVVHVVQLLIGPVVVLVVLLALHQLVPRLDVFRRPRLHAGVGPHLVDPEPEVLHLGLQPLHPRGLRLRRRRIEHPRHPLLLALENGKPPGVILRNSRNLAGRLRIVEEHEKGVLCQRDVLVEFPGLVVRDRNLVAVQHRVLFAPLIVKVLPHFFHIALLEHGVALGRLRLQFHVLQLVVRTGTPTGDTFHVSQNFVSLFQVLGNVVLFLENALHRRRVVVQPGHNFVGYLVGFLQLSDHPVESFMLLVLQLLLLRPHLLVVHVGIRILDPPLPLNKTVHAAAHLPGGFRYRLLV